jgi:hypothetical protein
MRCRLAPIPRGACGSVGILTALFVLCLAFFIAAMWMRGSSFQKCSGLENAAERYACYDKLRDNLSKPPAKGPDIPKG